MRGSLLVVALVGALLLGISALVAVVGLESGAVGNTFVPPGATPQNLPEPDSEGAKLLATYCQSCHNLPSPGLHDGQQWPAVVARMRAQMEAQVMGMAPKPSETQQQAIVRYLVRHARE
jgi:cytochrome c5